MRKTAILFLIALVILTGGIAPNVLAQDTRKAAKAKREQLEKRDPRLDGRERLKLKRRADELRDDLRKDDLRERVREGRARELGQKKEIIKQKPVATQPRAPQPTLPTQRAVLAGQQSRQTPRR